MAFSETIVVYDIKVGRCSQLDMISKLVGWTFWNFFSLETARPIEAKFYVEQEYKWFMSHDQDGRHARIW